MRSRSTGGASVSLSSFTCLFSVGTHILRSSQGKMRSFWFFFFFFFFGSGSDFCPVSTPVALLFSEVGSVQEVICCVGLRSHLRFYFGFQFPLMRWDVMRCKKAIYLHRVCKTVFRWFCHFGLSFLTLVFARQYIYFLFFFFCFPSDSFIWVLSSLVCSHIQH